MKLEKIVPFVAPSLLILASLIVAVLFLAISSQRPLTNLENVLLQLFTLGLGLVGSFFIGRLSAREVALDIIKPHARSAFRRLLSLYNSLSRMARTIQEATEKTNPTSAEIVLANIESVVIEQIASADDALEDWRDIIPDDVEQIQKRIKKK